jgi:alkylmercury lyase
MSTDPVPITVGEVARTAGVDVADIAAAPAAGDIEYEPAAGDIEYDNLHRIVGWGLTLNPTPHRYVVDGRLLYTWCAADTLLFPAILGKAARIESPCPTTGITIRPTVDPEVGIADLDPAGAVMSIPGRDQLDTDRLQPRPLLRRHRCRRRMDCAKPNRRRTFGRRCL